MDVLTHIKEEHEEFKDLMQRIEKSEDKNKKQLFRELYASLHGHHEAEEHVVYPPVKEKTDEKGKETIREMVEEHSLLNYQLSLVERTSVDNETWDAKFSVLKEVIEHHIDEEEEDFIPLARKELSKEILEKLLDEFEAVLERYKKEKKKELS